jgi:hypothetical protein
MLEGLVLWFGSGFCIFFLGVKGMRNTRVWFMSTEEKKDSRDWGARFISSYRD